MNSSVTAPVAVFVYSRLDKAWECLSALEKCKLANESDIHIFADGYKGEKDREKVISVQEWVNRYAADCKAFKSVTVHIKEHNVGLAKSIISGATELINKSGRVIVIEDDLLVSRGFLEYMNGALDFYEKDENIWEIASYGYNLKALRKYPHDVYLSYRSSSWGWATWKDRWNGVDWEVKDYEQLQNSVEMQKKFCRGGGDLYPMLQMQMRGELDSWAIRWNYAGSKKNALTVYPKHGLVRNFGFDGSGTHSGMKAPNYVFDGEGNKIKLEKLVLDPKITREFYLLHTDTFWKKVKRNLSIKDVIKLIKRVFNAERRSA